MCSFNIIWRAGWIYCITSWVQCSGQSLDCTTLTACIPAFKGKHYRDSLCIYFTVEQCQLLLQLIQLLLIGLSVQPLTQIYLLKNAFLQVILSEFTINLSGLCYLLFLIALFKSLYYSSKNLHCRISLIMGFDNRPRCILCICPCKHLICHTGIFFIMLISVFVCFADSPTGLFL